MNFVKVVQTNDAATDIWGFQMASWDQLMHDS